MAATLYDSYARGTADAYSDLDLGLITTDEAFLESIIACYQFPQAFKTLAVQMAVPGTNPCHIPLL